MGEKRTLHPFGRNRKDGPARPERRPRTPIYMTGRKKGLNVDMWIFNLVFALWLPVFLIVYCNVYRNKAPKDINGGNGYKTAMSRLNRDTWEFANRYYNRMMRVAGWILLVFSLAVMLFVRGKGKQTAENSGLALLAVQVAVLMICMIPTERALRRTFDENGNRK